MRRRPEACPTRSPASFYYVKAAITTLDGTDDGAPSARFVTAEHWRLFQLYPVEMYLATKPVTDLFARQVRAAQEQGLITVSDATRPRT